MMQDLGRAYVAHVNKRHGRTGALYEGRFKSSLVETTRYFLACMRYIEMNPLRARMADRPGAFEWSSYGQNITGEPGGLLTPHAEYLMLGRDAVQRAVSYGRLFEEPEDADELDTIRRGAAQGAAVGTDVYCQGIARLIGKPVATVCRGRPKVFCPLFGRKGL